MPRVKKEKSAKEAIIKKPRVKRTSKRSSSVKSGPKIPSKYNHQAIEKKWQQFWEENSTFKTSEDSNKEKIYILDMFPYPSGSGLHVGHLLGYIGTDILTRFNRMTGKGVLHPMGWDAFGLPAEVYAVKTGIHPRITTEKNIDTYRRQLKLAGLSYDWSREINTTDPEYYRWTQWIFLQLFKKGLAYEAEVPVNWCRVDKAILANEELVNGRCDRCGSEVERRKVRQWMLKITAYADRLLEGLEKLDWPDSIKKLQADWIGKKEGVKVLFQVRSAKNTDIEIFTTRVDTIFGATFIVLAPENPLIEQIVTPAHAEQVKIYIGQALNKADLDREIDANAPKTGVSTGAYAINPVTGEEIPIWVSDYVLGNVGTGAIMGVPAHDSRDFAFAKAHDLPIRAVVKPERREEEFLTVDDRVEDVELPYEGEGLLVDSGSFTAMHSPEARKVILDYLVRRGEGERVYNYKLRDWVFSRQRYWGEPIPLIHCPSCGIVPVPENELPLLLPEVEKYEPTGTTESPLAGISDWVETKCPKCNEDAKRETNTMPQWAGSCWYYLRFIDPKNDKSFVDNDLEKNWMPVDKYVGGAEHAVLHLLYARFWHKVLYDLGHVATDEPFQALRNQGTILGPDGQKMSKSKGNVINPDEIIEEYGTDTLRVYEMFMGPFEDAKPWNTRSMIGVHRFLNRIYEIVAKLTNKELPSNSSAEINNKLQILVNKVSADIENMKFNTAIAALMQFSHDLLAAGDQVSKKSLCTFVLLFSPFAPHLAEELWEMLGGKNPIQQSTWPEVKKVKEEKLAKIIVQVNGKLRDSIQVSPDWNDEKVIEFAKDGEKLKPYLADGFEKAIYIKGKVLNFVVPQKKK